MNLDDDQRRVPYAIKVAACADYLLGKSQAEIEHKHNVSYHSVVKWIRARGCFKLHSEGRSGNKQYVQ